MDGLSLPDVPLSWLQLARECWSAARYLVVRHRVRQKWASEALAEQCRLGGILVSHWCPWHGQPQGAEREALLAGSARKYGQPLWCGCRVVREMPGYSPYGRYDYPDYLWRLLVSSSLHWRPRPKPPEENDLPPALRYALTRNSMTTDLDFFRDGAVYGKDDLRYLHGLRDGGVDGANELIELIHLHGEVELYLEH